ncbi:MULTISPECIES: LysR family transcriptional regulator [unclassified Pseudomonas]|jgi:DNA-binding transcriptional LysR family regulator|uniref:LysR family transcriptional regulator n=1 Tax=unclassified Pseudomonas TaxID=196821 RepID=UPI001F1C7ABF|nr:MULTISPECIES: LysR family transcriptional regulator [unclassified Pseudomonas]MCF5233211.1 LysR family transcriptional regulator [Pseudomonas sp. PA-5-4H]MCF5237444.1 LysR family transcriptional regulator [Pseudomonas sp. PA-5-4G]MCF5251431.1 LysR family transcriptional regulator [Pseudomonas sp. PA-5-4B]MCF5257102.1 LysR family transcriptional regulator [Pseudomonas sp. PA-5-4B]MCF5263361.1 LysR family transcriptional regulator [Pseudomonas sp. PA-5-4A]
MALQANWDDLRLLLAVSRRGSFLQAGQMLGIAASTVSRRLTQLESALGELLVERGVEGCWLTSRGQSLVEVALAAEAGLRRQTVAGMSGLHTELFGSVLVSAGEGFSSCVLEAASRFTSLHPRCSVELMATADFHKIVRGVADIAVRTAHLGEPSLIYRPIGRLAYGVFADAGYLKRYPGVTPATAVNIALLPPLDMLPQMRAAKAAGLERAQISVNSFAVQLESVRRGMGVAVLPRILAKDLIELFPDFQLPDMEVYLVTRPQALKQAHIKCFFAILEQVLLEALSIANAEGYLLGGDPKWVHGGASQNN